MATRPDHRSPLQRARGLGAAGSGVAAWWWQRVTAVALVPLALWFVIALIGVAGTGRQALLAWLASPAAAIPMVLLLGALFWHTALGLIVVTEDYVHHRGAKVVMVASIQLACLGLALAGALAVLALALGAP